jgi:phosphomannomutase/phosphoglucomutase
MSPHSQRLIGTDGVRGVTNVALTPEFITRLSEAIGYYFGKGSKVLVGKDARAGSYYIHHIVVGTLLSEGVKVFDAGLTPTPALQYYVKENGFDGGVMITASHNPPEYSGLKVILGDGIEAPREVEKEIEGYFFEGRVHRPSWIELGYDVKKIDDVLDFYVASVIDKVDKDLIRASSFKVVVDGANNVGSLTTPKMLKELGAKVTTLNTEISHIPNRLPEPTPESLVQLSNVVRSSNSHLGVAHDGDADRAIFVDDSGRVIPGDRSAVLLCRHILANREDNLPRRIITAVSSSTIVEDVLKKYGVEVI